MSKDPAQIEEVARHAREDIDKQTTEEADELLTDLFVRPWATKEAQDQ